MKDFKDLKFKAHPAGNGSMARLFFPNGYGISVVRFQSFGRYGSYTSDETEWECAVLKGNEKESEICYETPLTSDVIGHLDESGVTDLMRQIQKLKKGKDK